MSRLAPAASVPVIPGVLSLTHVRNTGIAFGLFPGLRPEVVPILALTLLAVLFYNKGRWLATRAVGAGIALIAGGAVGNIIDRVRYGYVVDFLDFHVWPVFNVADTAVVIGAAILVLASWRGGGGTGQSRG